MAAAPAPSFLKRRDVLFVGMRASERVEVLLAQLARVMLDKGQVEAVAPRG